VARPDKAISNFSSTTEEVEDKMKFARVFALFVIVAVAAVSSHGQTYYYTMAGDGISTLQSNWYNSSTGLYNTGGWWHSANAITTLAGYEATLGDNAYYWAFSSTYTNAQSGSGGHANFENMYYDDTGWWALAWLDGYDLTANSSYLSMAETIFSYETGGWKTDECGGGGMNWSTASTYQNAVTNELFLTLAAKLANRTTGSTSTMYKNWANNEWNWFKASGTINSQNLINDGVNSVANGCGNNGGQVWTYNRGVILGGLVELAQADNDPSLIAQAQTIANSVLNSYGTSTPLVDANGILTENQPLNGSTDMPQFKGIFARNLATLYNAAPVPAYKTFLDNNASSIWNSDQTTGYRFGYAWQGPVDAEDAVRQSSADDALVGVVRVQDKNAVGSFSTTAFGSMQAYAGDGSGNIWVNWQQRGKGGLIAPANWQPSWREFSMGSVHSTGTPAVSADGIGRQWVFIPTRGDVYSLAESTTGGGWGSWTDMGSSSNGLVFLHALYSANGGQYVFGQKSGTVYYASKPNASASWSSFTALSGLSPAAYNVAINAQTGYVEVFGVDSSGAVWTDTQTGLSTWRGWATSGLMGQTVQGYVTAVSNSEGGMQVFALDSSSNVLTNYQATSGGAWSGWVSLGNVKGGVSVQPGFICGKNADGTLQLFAVGSDGSLHTKYQTSPASNTWSSSWTSLGQATGQPLYSYLVDNNSPDGRILVMGVSKTNPYNIYGIWESYPNTYTAWNGWQNWGGAGLRFYGNQL
jgi:predicted alpha-1,6-mannanase (GH76 family)